MITIQYLDAIHKMCADPTNNYTDSETDYLAQWED